MLLKNKKQFLLESSCKDMELNDFFFKRLEERIKNDELKNNYLRKKEDVIRNGIKNIFND